MAGVVEGGACGEGLDAEGEVAGCLLRREAAEGAAVGKDDGASVIGLVDADGFALVELLVLGVGEGGREVAGFGLIEGLGVDVETVVEACDGPEDIG